MALPMLRLMLPVVFLCGSIAHAEEPAKLITKYNCLGCHATDKRIVGPSYKEVAVKYRSQKDAEAMLMKGIRSGVQGKWGQIPMPPQQISDADLRAIVRWVLVQ